VTLVPVADPADPRLAEYVDLRDVSARKLLEAEHGIFIAEGEKVIRRAAEAGFEPRSFLLAERWLDSLSDVLARWPDVPVYVVSGELAEHVTGFHVHRGALASYRRRPDADLDTVLAGARRIVERANVGARSDTGGQGGSGRVAVFDGFVDHANVGAGFRAAAALGVDAVLITPTCADPLYRRSIKVSMGTVFQVPWARIPNWPSGGIERLHAHGFTVAAFALTENSILLDELGAARYDNLAMVFGTEGHGLDQRVLLSVDATVRIPMSGGVDSLNVASATAVAFYTTRAR
jgi:tRNA G18 (ribose-2'-O)-methylase SpoU